MMRPFFQLFSAVRILALAPFSVCDSFMQCCLEFLTRNVCCTDRVAAASAGRWSEGRRAGAWTERRPWAGAGQTWTSAEIPDHGGRRGRSGTLRREIRKAHLWEFPCLHNDDAPVCTGRGAPDKRQKLNLDKRKEIPLKQPCVALTQFILARHFPGDSERRNLLRCALGITTHNLVLFSGKTGKN